MVRMGLVTKAEAEKAQASPQKASGGAVAQLDTEEKKRFEAMSAVERETLLRDWAIAGRIGGKPVCQRYFESRTLTVPS